MSASLHSKIHSKIISTIRRKGRISFEEYMELALYEPNFGYYTGNAIKFGKKGDFVTAPEISPLFSECLARNFLGIASRFSNASILEFGAGTGKMAADILQALDKYQALPEYYFIYEVSPELQKRQHETINKLNLSLRGKVVWLESLSEFKNKFNVFNGLILANEVLDAMPVRRFCLQEQKIFEYYVTEHKESLFFEKLILKNEKFTDEMLTRYFTQIKSLIQNEVDESEEYIFEINFNVCLWLKRLSCLLTQGAALIIDYGFPRHELYHRDRSMGTLMCHYQHQAHSDPLLYPGRQDITTHVDFSLIAEIAYGAGFEILGFIPQAGFLLNSGLIELLEDIPFVQKMNTVPEMSQKMNTVLELSESDVPCQTKNEIHRIQQNHAIQLLTSPAEMGELFKVIGLGKNCDSDLLPGFSMNDQRHRL